MSGYYIVAAVLVFIGQMCISATANEKNTGQVALATIISTFYLFLFVYGALVL